MNDIAVIPRPDKIICKMLVNENKTKTGLIIPDQEKSRNYSQRGEVVAIGSQIRLNELKISDIVIYMAGIGEYTHDVFSFSYSDNEKYVVINEEDIFMIERKIAYVPVNDYIVCKTFEEKEITKSGLIVPTAEKEKRTRLFRLLYQFSNCEELQELERNTLIYANFFYSYKTKNINYKIIQKEDIQIIML